MAALYDLLKEKLNKLEVEGETYYVAEGDTLLDEEQLKIFAEVREKEIAARKARREADEQGFGTAHVESSHGLVAATRNGKVVRWAPGTVLTYRVVRASFATEQEYRTVVDNMIAATREWEMTCGVNFQHKKELDGKRGVGREGCLFVVYKFDAGGKVIASAFFPSDPRERRHVLVDGSYFTTGFDKVGVFRHELGHVLGFRHEHVRNEAPAACPNEPLWDAQPLGKYDPKSVMHYFCGEVGSRELKISDLDRKGAQLIYGPPLGAAALVD